MSRKPRKYAQGTKTNIETTQIAIRRLLEQFGAVDGFVTGEQAGIAVLSFHMQSRRLTFRFAIPRVRPGEERKNAAAVNETKRLWRAVLLCIKAMDWWWDWMPRWLFFLVLGGMALVVMVLLKRVQARAGGAR